MRIILAALVLLVAASGPVSARRVIEPANDGWSFFYLPQQKKAPKGIPPQAKPDFDDKDWKKVGIPHTWQTYETTGELHPFIASPHAKDNAYWWTGTGFYRKRFTLKEPLGEDRLFIEFDGVMKYCKAYLNGWLVGEHFGGYGCFTFDLTPYLDDKGENLLAIEVGNEQNDPHAIPPMDAGCWNFYGGIYRNVRFVRTGNIYIPFQGSAEYQGGTQITSRNIGPSRSDVRIRTWVKNDTDRDTEVTLETAIVDRDGKTVRTLTQTRTIYHRETLMFDQTGIIYDPLRWSPDSPDQYTAVSTVSVGDAVADVYESRFGIRTFFWNHDEKVLYVNGEPVNLQGFNRHQEYPWLGDAIPYFIHRMDLMDMKYNLGCNALRPGQYCSGPEVFALADSLGLITFAELPNVKNRNFSPQMQRIQTVEMVRRLRNSPSVLLFDMGDETDRAADSRWAHDESPDHYITCRHCEGTGGEFISISPQELKMSKMLRCAVRGWYSSDDKDLEPENQQWTGTDEYRHRIALQGKKEGQNDDRIDQPNLVVWLYEDHGCDREYRNAPLLHYNPKGWVDSYRIPKYAYYLWQANYSGKPMVYAMPHFWRSRYIGTFRDITVDSNCEEVTLIAGGKKCGTKRLRPEDLH
ncbi:MAG: glycoside hydrolase family 2 protein, partial [Candidatus Cryptobacteroides sp.]